MSPAARSTSPDIDPALLEAAQRYLGLRQRRIEPTADLAAAWGEFYRRYEPLLRRTVAGCGLKGADAEDCLQEIWQALSVRLIRFIYDPARGRFCDWLMRLARREAGRFRHRRAYQVLREHARDRADRAAPESDGPLACCERAELQERVGQALVVLQQRISLVNYLILYAFWWRGCTLAEIALELEMTEPQVRWRHHWVKQKLRALVESPKPA